MRYLRNTLSLLLAMLMLAGMATSVFAGAWKPVSEAAPGALSRGMLGSTYPHSPKYDWPACKNGSILKGTVVTGVGPDGQHCWADGTDNASCAFDGDIVTFFDPFEATDQSWVGLRLDRPYELTEVRICSRAGWDDRTIGAAVQGSNDDGLTWHTVVYFDPAIFTKPLLNNDYYIIPSAKNAAYIKANTDAGVPAASADFSRFWVSGGAYAMYRYVTLGGAGLDEPNHGDVAEIELYGNPAKVAGNPAIVFTGTPASTYAGSIPGKVIGCGAIWNNSSDGYANAWDGRGDTFYDPGEPGPDYWTGILADSAYTIREVRVLPRIGFFDRTAGAHLQASNDGKTWVTLASFTAEDCLNENAAQGWIRKTVKDTGSYWMFRYINDGTSHGDVADVALVGTKGNASLTYPGQVVGTVLSTDIRAYINGAEIPAYNIAGKLAILVSDLNNYGFKTAFDNTLRKTGVTRNKSAASFTSVPSKASGLPIGTPVMSVYSTDISVELDGVEVPAFNVDNRMAIYFTELKPYGTLVYDNGSRSSSLTLSK